MTDKANRRAAFISELGIGPLWKRRDTGENSLPAIALPDDPAPLPKDPGNTKVPGVSENAVTNLPAIAVMPVNSLEAAGTAPSADQVADMDWSQLQVNVANCVKCGLCKNRTKTVFGTGDVKAKWLFVGEGPGRNEDLQGEPFIGPAGKLLDNMLLAIGLKRGENAYVANIVKCRPVGADGRDRPPTAEEAAACLPYLERQIALIQPSIVVALGKTAAVSLLGLGADTPVSNLRGKLHQYNNLPLVVTYHPAYLLRKLADKRKAWDDLCLAMNAYAGDTQ